jgi:hypothetical protein
MLSISTVLGGIAFDRFLHRIATYTSAAITYQTHNQEARGEHTPHPESSLGSRKPRFTVRERDVYRLDHIQQEYVRRLLCVRQINIGHRSKQKSQTSY